MDLDEDQRLYLSLVLDHFRSTGEWPILRDIQREMVRQIGRSVDATAVVSRLPPPARRFTTHLQSPAILDVAALALIDGTDEELNDFLAVVDLAVSRYLGSDQNPRVSSQDLARKTGMDESRLRKVGALLRLEGLIIAGGVMSEDPYQWTYEVSDYVHRFASVKTINGYLSTRSDESKEALSLVGSNILPSVSSARGKSSAYTLDSLHPHVRVAAGELYLDGHFPQAVFEALKAVEVRVGEISRLDSSGRDLMAKAFSGDPPAIDVKHESGRNGDDEREGFKLISWEPCRGFAIRKLTVRFDRKTRFASLLMHRLDDTAREGE